MVKYSIIIPVYNRPDEVEELLESLTEQTYTNFEVLIIEDGSDIPCGSIVEKYTKKLNLSYYYKPNSGPGTSRNYGSEQAQGMYFIFFDSDCIIPSSYMQAVEDYLNTHTVDAFGGPDMAHPSFSPLQKAINYSMTSFFTTGGIRGGKKQLEKFHPRSFNMGYSRQVYSRTQGFSAMRFGEDIDMSIRILKEGFRTALIHNAAVYHKRRTDFRKFYKQVYNSGIARINLFVRYPSSLKIVHTLPFVFLLGCFIVLLLSIINPLFLSPILLYTGLIFLHSTVINRSLWVGILSIPAAFIQLWGYGIGFIGAAVQRLVLGKKEYHAFVNNFYK